MTRAVAKTPVRVALRKDSPLLSSVEEGIAAVESTDRECFDASIRNTFDDSLNLDLALRRGRERENRWDYLLGHGPSGAIVAVEPHSAKDDEVETVIKKRSAAREQLRAHLRNGAVVSKWLWVASGKVRFAETEKTARRLDQNGIEFVGKKVMRKHLPPEDATTTSRSTSGAKGR